VSVAAEDSGAPRAHLRRTLESGQTFRWRWERDPAGGETAVGVVGRSVLRLRQEGERIRLLSPRSPEAEGAFARYFDSAGTTGRVGDIEEALAGDPVLARILPHTRGIAILVQDPWEVLISFIVSQNNNIPKITQSIERLARALGDPLDGGAYAFPQPARLASAHPQTLRACLLGYRAPYVRAAARLVMEGDVDLPALHGMPEEEARHTLRGIPGVGEKVGDCVLLFGLRHMTAFPVDVWVRRAVERLYLPRRRLTLREIRTFARNRFGPLAGYAQQHLFAYARAHLKETSAGGRTRPATGR
jgi:N-glycosylase/DNA lyase